MIEWVLKAGRDSAGEGPEMATKTNPLMKAVLGMPTSMNLEAHRMLTEKSKTQNLDEHERMVSAALADAVTINEGIDDLLSEFFDDDGPYDQRHAETGDYPTYHDALLWALAKKKG